MNLLTAELDPPRRNRESELSLSLLEPVAESV